MEGIDISEKTRGHSWIVRGYVSSLLRLPKSEGAMVTPFLTLQQLSALFSKPSSILLQDAEAPQSAVEEFLQNCSEEQHQDEHSRTFRDVA